MTPDAVCEYCGKPAIAERKDRVRTISVCEDCLEDLQQGDELQRDEDAYERAVDQSLSEWKDEGRVGMPRAVRRHR
jgi:hypothetical protein